MKLVYWLDLISVGVVGMIMYPFLRALQTRDLGHLAHGLGIILADVVSKVIKRLTQTTGARVFERPAGARDCDVMCRNGDVSGRPGMPSGHATIAAYFVAYFVGYELRGRWLSLGGGGALTLFLLVIAARVWKRCHNLLQVLVGTLLGAAVGLGVLYGTGTAPPK